MVGLTVFENGNGVSYIHDSEELPRGFWTCACVLQKDPLFKGAICDQGIFIV